MDKTKSWIIPEIVVGLVLCGNLSMAVPVATPAMPCDLCAMLKDVCGQAGICQDKGMLGNCSYECVCSDNKTGVGCLGSPANMPVVNERVEIKFNPVQSLDFTLLGESLFKEPLPVAPEPAQPLTKNTFETPTPTPNSQNRTAVIQPTPGPAAGTPAGSRAL